jgi:hypothetical protein
MVVPMSQLAPPEPPPALTFDEGGNIRRLRFRLWQLMMTVLTILATAWACTFFAVKPHGWIVGLSALFIAKHVLVAILVVGLGVDREKQ